jgi:DNA (cytosine-5)-methyltransferase 1
MTIAIDLFAGAGGLSEGLESVGIHVATAVELHPQAALTYAFNHPNTKVFAGDIQALSMNLLAESVVQATGQQEVDLVVGGPPCQGFSSAGKKVSTDPRNSLFQQFTRVVEHFHPRMFLLENVPGFRRMHQGDAYNNALALFRSFGYEVCDTVLDASEYGLPQRRQRFVMVGRLRKETNIFTWPETTHGHAEQTGPTLFDMFNEPFTTVFDALEDIAFLEPGWECHRHQSAPLSEYQRARRCESEFLFNHLATLHRPKAAEMFSFIPEGRTISSVPSHLRSGKKTMARLDRRSISNAVLAMPDDLIHYRHNRIPTVREMARLQSFDDTYVFFGKRTSGFVERRVDVPQYTQVGNAVPPLLGHALGRALQASLGGVVEDCRNPEERRSRLQWVRGSSGYAGYTLDLSAQGQIDIVDIHGVPLPLPLSETDELVRNALPLVEWTQTHNPKRGQWAPNIRPRSRPAYQLELIQ